MWWPQEWLSEASQVAVQGVCFVPPPSIQKSDTRLTFPYALMLLDANRGLGCMYIDGLGESRSHVPGRASARCCDGSCRPGSWCECSNGFSSGYNGSCQPD